MLADNSEYRTILNLCWPVTCLNFFYLFGSQPRCFRAVIIVLRMFICSHAAYLECEEVNCVTYWTAEPAVDAINLGHFGDTIRERVSFIGISCAMRRSPTSKRNLLFLDYWNYVAFMSYFVSVALHTQMRLPSLVSDAPPRTCMNNL